jgi:hypothetical protein
VDHLTVDDDAWRGHDAEAHDLGDVGDLLQLDLNAGLFCRLRDGVGGHLAIAAAGAWNFDRFHSSHSLVEWQHPPLSEICTGEEQFQQFRGQQHLHFRGQSMHFRGHCM